MAKSINIIAAPDLYADVSGQTGTVVLIDVIRFTTTLTAALCNGAEWVETYPDMATPLSLKPSGYLTAGERGALRAEGFDFGNSPLEFRPEIVKGRKIAFTTTNGTYAQSLVDPSTPMIAGAFVNINAVVEYLLRKKSDVTFLCSGTKRQPCFEDLLFAGAASHALCQKGDYEIPGDTANIALFMYQEAEKTGLKDFCLNRSARIQKLYTNLRDDIDFSFRQNVFDSVAIRLDKNKFKL